MRAKNLKLSLTKFPEQGTWLEHWKRHSGQEVALCAVRTCSSRVEVGAEVLRQGAPPGAVEIVPLCLKHSEETIFSLNLSDKAVLVPREVPEAVLAGPRQAAGAAGGNGLLDLLEPKRPEAEEAVLGDTAGALALPVRTVVPSMSCEELHELFLLQGVHQSLAVVDRGLPIGMVTRSQVVEQFSKLYFRDLYGKESLTRLMNAAPLIVDHGLSLDDLGLRMSKAGDVALQEGFIITRGGRYLGIGTGRSLLRELTERKEANLAVALERATKELRQAQVELLEKQRMQQELDIAREIQAALLPRSAPQIPGYEVLSYYRSAKEVGGDYFDFIALSGGRQALVVADVSGKGVPGSMGMTMARSVLRAQAAMTSSAAETLRRANSIVLPDLRAGMFVTVFYAILDPRAHRLSCACGGHNPAFVISAGGLRAVSPEGMALGLGGQDQYFVDEEEVLLQPGDTLVLYTDGVTEAMDPDEGEYGEERLVAALQRHQGASLQGLLDGVIADISGFTQGAAQADDITLVLLRRNASAS